MSPDTNVAFREQLKRPDGQIDLLRAALLIAADSYPGLDVEGYVARVDDWAAQLRRQIPADAGTETLLRRLNHFLFRILGFKGNTEDYYDPRNSFLNEVLDRRRGIPISLAVVYLEFAQRLDLAVRGVSFPGHFLVKLPHGGGEIVLDPYHRGVSLGEEELKRRLGEVFDSQIEDLSPFLQAASKRDILVRILSNLKGIYQQQGDAEQALQVVSKILLVNPTLTEQYRDRGLLLNALECYHAALKDLKTYLRARPEADDAEVVRKLVFGLQEDHSRIN
jgi:regulator of sirC expression with transglutaminase-like and TPR domain